MLQDITAEGITTENVCLYDTGALKFKFNEIEAQTRKFINAWPQDDCNEIDKILRLLRRSVKHCLEEVQKEIGAGLPMGE